MNNLTEANILEVQIQTSKNIEKLLADKKSSLLASHDETISYLIRHKASCAEIRKEDECLRRDIRGLLIAEKTVKKYTNKLKKDLKSIK